jgi:hypothetical protein
MAEPAGLELLNRRKRTLLTESELNRLALRLELENLRAATAGFDGARAAAQRAGPWLVPAAAVVGLLAARFLPGRWGALGKLTSALGWLSPALALWRHWRQTART